MPDLNRSMYNNNHDKPLIPMSLQERTDQNYQMLPKKKASASISMIGVNSIQINLYSDSRSMNYLVMQTAKIECTSGFVPVLKRH